MTKVRCKDLKVDYTYQSPLNEKQVKKIVANYNPILLDPIRCSRRKDGLYIFEGQCRTNAMLRLFGDDAEIEAVIYYDLTPEQEAELFLEFNTSKRKVSANDKIKARKRAGEDIVNAYFNLLDSTDLSYEISDSKTKSTSFIAHSMGLDVFNTYSNEVFKRACNVLSKSTKKDHITGRFLKVIARIINDCPQINDNEFAEAFDIFTVESIEASAVNHGRTNTSGSGVNVEPLVKGLLDLYNNSYRKNKPKFHITETKVSR